MGLPGPGLYYRYTHGDEIYNVATIYLCRKFSGEMTLDQQEVREAQWFSVTELPIALNPPDRVILEDYLRRLNPAMPTAFGRG